MDLHGASQYLPDELHQVAEVQLRRQLGLAATLIVPDTARSTISDHAFSGVEQSSALGDVINVPSGIPKPS